MAGNEGASANGAAAENGKPEYSLNDDRRVKTLSPSALVIKRFIRNRVAVTGLVILILMFAFSYIGGLISPYRQDQVFYRTELQNQDFAGVTENTDFRYVVKEGASFGSVEQAQFVLATIQKKDAFEFRGTSYRLDKLSDVLYGIYSGGELIAFASCDVVSSSVQGVKLPFELQYLILSSLAEGGGSFTYEGGDYTVDEDGGVLLGKEEVAYASRYIVQPIMSDVHLTRQFKEELIESIQNGEDSFSFTEADGSVSVYTVVFNAAMKNWNVRQETETRVFDTYSAPSKEHWLGTDKNGMDMLTRLMYGGRVSLYIGFIVVIIETTLGVLLGGVSGYFGGWVDMLIMRIVDIFYCIPSMPIIIILGAAMDMMRVDPQVRMIYLMLILGFLGWPGISRLVRGQILTLREQEFMMATEACGISVPKRIFRHLLPNVMPQLIVTMTMSLGSVILTEATLSFLGLGVKFPFASWGNIINDVNNTFVLTNYWFIWIPAGLCLLSTVLAFNLVGDGLRDAFDPKMKR
ncbi:MAG: ABC transporter permease [Lachnospiraceae bacterium]|nr:ABC transporter permease [Lachnospiraceae bacterium]